MKVATNLGVAMMEAALRSGVPSGLSHWVARSIIDKATYTTAGVKEVPAVEVHVSKRTHDRIAAEQHVDVWK